MRLDDLPAGYADRVTPAKDCAPWAPRCNNAHEAKWIAWNVCEDFWYGPAELARVRAVIDAVDVDTPGLHGPDLLALCAASLKNLRVMTPDERDRLPDAGVNHASGTRFLDVYDLAPESAWAESNPPGALSPSLRPGTTVRVLPRGPYYFRWITFEARGVAVPKDPDEVSRTLGLDWKPAYGTVMRVVVPIAALRLAGASFAIPTVFEVLHDTPGRKLSPDWRARPEVEHRTGEPWGHARDMTGGGAALPEVMADITQAGRMSAEILGIVGFDWSTRPFLGGSGPR